MKASLVVTSEVHPSVVIASIRLEHCEMLRALKNSNREYFFYKGLINTEQQREWFDGYLERTQDYMFTVRHSGADVGVAGFRELDHHWDLYNIILKDSKLRGSGVMSQALVLLCSAARAIAQLPIQARVLNSNPAMQWYLKNGLVVRETTPEYATLIADPRTFDFCEVSLSSAEA